MNSFDEYFRRINIVHVDKHGLDGEDIKQRKLPKIHDAGTNRIPLEHEVKPFFFTMFQLHILAHPLNPKGPITQSEKTQPNPTQPTQPTTSIIVSFFLTSLESLKSLSAWRCCHLHKILHASSSRDIMKPRLLKIRALGCGLQMHEGKQVFLVTQSCAKRYEATPDK